MQSYAHAGVWGVCVGWGAWNTGMAVGVRKKLEQVGIGLIEAWEGLRVLERIVSGSSSCSSSSSRVGLVAAKIVSFDRMAARGGRSFYSEFLNDSLSDAHVGGRDVVAVESRKRQKKKSQSKSAVKQRDVKSIVTGVVLKTLGVSGIVDEQPLVAAGLDSLGAGEVKAGLERELDTPLPATLVFDYPSIRAITEHVESLLTDQESEEEEEEEDEERRVSDEHRATVRTPLEPQNTNAPTLLNTSDYYTIPDISILQHQYTDAQLQRVDHFIVGRHGVGEIQFLYPVDLRAVQLDTILDIQRGMVDLDVGISLPGSGLNQPALLTMKKIFPKGDGRHKGVVQAFRGVLLQAAQRMGATFVHWDPDQGVWILKVDSW